MTGASGWAPGSALSVRALPEPSLHHRCRSRCPSRFLCRFHRFPSRRFGSPEPAPPVPGSIGGVPVPPPPVPGSMGGVPVPGSVGGAGAGFSGAGAGAGDSGAGSGAGACGAGAGASGAGAGCCGACCTTTGPGPAVAVRPAAADALPRSSPRAPGPGGKLGGRRLRLRDGCGGGNARRRACGNGGGVPRDRREAEHHRADCDGRPGECEQHGRTASTRLGLLAELLVLEVDLGPAGGRCRDGLIVDVRLGVQDVIRIVVDLRPRQRTADGGRGATADCCRGDGGGGRSGGGHRRRGFDDLAPCAISATPSAAVSCGCGVVTTVVRRCSESRCVISGMRAPPPIVATAEMLATGIRLRSKVSASAARNSARGSSIRWSSSIRVIRTVVSIPGTSMTDRGGRLVRKPFLRAPALVAQHGKGTDHRGACRVGVGRVEDACHDIGQDGLVDLVAREVGHADRLTDRGVVRRRVDNRDAGAAAAEVAEHDHTCRRKARVRAQRRQRRFGIGHQWRAGQSRLAAEGAAQRLDDGRAPNARAPPPPPPKPGPWPRCGPRRPVPRPATSPHGAGNRPRRSSGRDRRRVRRTR